MKTNNSTKWKYLLFFGLGSLVVGLSLLAFGAAAGGIEGIKDNTKATKEVQSFDKVKNLQIDSFYNVVVKSGNVDKVTITYYNHDKFRPKTQIEHNGDTLKISQANQGSFVTGFMETGGYLLNQREGSRDYNTTTITIPEGLVLDSLEGSMNDVISSISDIKVKNLSINTGYLSNVSAENGRIFSYDIYISDSQLKNISFDNTYNISLENTTLENSTINNFTGYISAEKSLLKNISFTAPEQEITVEDDSYRDDYNYDDEYSYSDRGQLSLNNSTLENITYKGDGEVTGHDVTLIGKIDLSGSILSADLKLTKDSRKMTSLDLATDQGTISLDQKSPENSGVTVNGAANSFSQKVDKAKAELIIKSKRGYISLY